MNSTQFNEIREFNNRGANDVTNFLCIECTPCVQRINEMGCIENLRKSYKFIAFCRNIYASKSASAYHKIYFAFAICRIYCVQCIICFINI